MSRQTSSDNFSPRNLGQGIDTRPKYFSAKNFSQKLKNQNGEKSKPFCPRSILLAKYYSSKIFRPKDRKPLAEISWMKNTLPTNTLAVLSL